MDRPPMNRTGGWGSTTGRFRLHEVPLRTDRMQHRWVVTTTRGERTTDRCEVGLLKA